MDSPLVTVIIPLYNTEKYIEQCLQSVISQTYSNLEVIVVNDGSTDDSRESVEAFCLKDSRIKLINQENSGVSSARNTGIDASKGEYICFLDSDDYLRTDFLEELIQFTDRAQIVVCNYVEVTDSESQERKVIPVSKEGDSKSDLLCAFQSKCCWTPWGKLYQSDLIKKSGIKFKKNCSLGEDLLFNTEIIIANPSFRVFLLDKPLYYYRVNPNGLSKQIGQSDFDNLLLQEHILGMLDNAGLGQYCYNILFNAVLAFYSKYNRLSKQSQIEWGDRLLVAKNIVRRNKTYLLKKDGKTSAEWLKMLLIVYAPGVFSFLYHLNKSCHR